MYQTLTISPKENNPFHQTKLNQNTEFNFFFKSLELFTNHDEMKKCSMNPINIYFGNGCFPHIPEQSNELLPLNTWIFFESVAIFGTNTNFLSTQ